MTTPNENEDIKQVSNYIEINENGELVVKDPKLAESLEELSTEELEQIAGGDNVNCPTNISHCRVEEGLA